MLIFKIKKRKKKQTKTKTNELNKNNDNGVSAVTYSHYICVLYIPGVIIMVLFTLIPKKETKLQFVSLPPTAGPTMSPKFQAVSTTDIPKD